MGLRRVEKAQWDQQVQRFDRSGRPRAVMYNHASDVIIMHTE
jgi:hypothetical protein